MTGVQTCALPISLYITGLSDGSDTITVRLYDLDNDYDERTISITVEGEDNGGGSSSGGGSRICTANWTCSEWGECVGNIKSRSCNDKNNCGVGLNKPFELTTCASELGEGMTIKLESDTKKEPRMFSSLFSSSTLWFLILLILILLIIIITKIVFYRKKLK